MKPQRKGFTFRYPDGSLDWRITDSVEGAQSNAAFASVDSCSIQLPRDWDRAHAAGYRIVPARLTVGPSRGAWKKLHRQTE